MKITVRAGEEQAQIGPPNQLSWVRSRAAPYMAARSPNLAGMNLAG
jgi:hypothetical protein